MGIKLKSILCNILVILVEGLPAFAFIGFVIWVCVELKNYNNDIFTKIRNDYHLTKEDIKELRNVDKILLESYCKSLMELSKISLNEKQLSMNFNVNKEIVCSLAKDKGK